MVQVRVSSLEIGDVLLEDVLTHRGNILFYKGTVLTERDLEILKAFMIDEVAIDPSGSKREILEIPDDSSSGSSLSDAQIFEQHYEQLLQIMKRVFRIEVSPKTYRSLRCAIILKSWYSIMTIRIF